MTVDPVTTFAGKETTSGESGTTFCQRGTTLGWSGATFGESRTNLRGRGTAGGGSGKIPGGRDDAAQDITPRNPRRRDIMPAAADVAQGPPLTGLGARRTIAGAGTINGRGRSG